MKFSFNQVLKYHLKIHFFEKIYFFYISGTAYVDFFSSASPNKPEGEIWSRLDQSKQLVSNVEEIEKMMLDNGDFVGFLPSISTETSYTSIPCRVSTRSEPYFVVSLSWPFQQNSPYLALFDYNLNKAKETGELKSLVHYAPETFKM